MIVVILLLSGALLCASAVLLVRPALGFDFGSKYFPSAAFQYGTAVFSVALGFALYFVSASTRFPTVFEILSLATLAGAVICFILPQSDFQSVVAWEIKTFRPYGRLLGLCYAIVAVFLVVAAT